MVDTVSYGSSAITAPVGSIIAWHKSMDGTPDLPNGWVEMNGQTLDDPSSVYDGKTIPALNSNGRFLKGATTSGSENNKTTHTHTATPNTHPYFITNSGDSHPAADTQFTTGATFGSDPSNFTVVWIMRIK